MDLILWRHAEAEDPAPGMSDEERALTRRGEKQARKMAKWLNKRLPKDVRILASPALRCQQTAQALNRPFETSEDLATDTSAQRLLKAAGCPDAGGTILIVGHQPSLGQIVSILTTGRESDWSVKKGAVWWLAMDNSGSPSRTSLHLAICPGLV